MNTNYFKNSYFIFLILLISVILFANNDCKSQQINNDYKLTASINFSSLVNNEAEQSLRGVKSGQILKYLKLNSKEKELLKEIKQLSAEAKLCLNDADLIDKEINEIYNSERKTTRQENYELSYRYDAEELFELSNSILFKIYEDHFPSGKALFAKESKDQKQIMDLNKEAQELFKKANKNQDKANYDLNYNTGLDYLKKANFLKIAAIKKYEQAYSIFYNIPINKDEYNILYAEINMNNSNDPGLGSDSLINYKDNPNSILPGSDNANENNKPIKLNEMIVYRVQIGAFIKKVDVNEFHGLYPLTKDFTDQKKYTKFMVGEYFSYKAATEAKRIIAKTTKYKDAFLVAYKNDVRVTVNNELIK